MDLLLRRRRYGFELESAPRAAKSMRVVLSHLDPERLRVVYPGDRVYAMTERIHALLPADAGRILRAERFG